MKFLNVLFNLGLLATAIAAPSQQAKRDVNIYIQESVSEHSNTADTPTLYFGVYSINSLAQASGTYIGRSLREDKSLNPKYVVVLPSFDYRSEWFVEPVNGKFKMSVMGAPTLQCESRLCAAVSPERTPEEWEAIWVEDAKAFRIRSSDKTKEWYASSQMDSIVEIRNSASGIPPKESLFKFQDPRRNGLYAVEKTTKNNKHISTSDQHVSSSIDNAVQSSISEEASSKGSLETGIFFISGLAQPSGAAIGRFKYEDHSILPKRIMTIKSDEYGAQWILEKVGDNKFILKTGGAWTAPYREGLYAILLDEPKAEEWILTLDKDTKAYRIQTSDKSKEWYAGNDMDSQVELRKSSSGTPSKEALFKITPLSDDGYSISEDIKDTRFTQSNIESNQLVSTQAGGLPRGRYIIKSPGLRPDQTIGRNIREDLSLLPKKVITGNIGDTYYGSNIWELQPADGGRYILKIGNAPTGIIDNKLFAILLDFPQPEEWVLTNVDGRTFTIQSRDGNKQWVANTESEGQVEIRPSAGQYPPPTAVFTIEPFGQDMESSKFVKTNIKVGIEINGEL